MALKPKLAANPVIDFVLRGDHIELHQLLKATGLASSGGEGKLMVAQGLVRVDGQAESRKTAKIHAGQRVELNGQLSGQNGGQTIQVAAAASDTTSS